MATESEFDVAAAHAFFAPGCFQEAWALMDRPGRTAEDDLELVALVHAAIFHTRRRADAAPHHLALGDWQAARAHALLGRPAEAARWGAVALRYAVDHDLAPFYAGYAHEALARAAALRGDRAAVERHLHDGEALAARVDDPEERALLEADLGAVRGLPGLAEDAAGDPP